MQICKKIDVHAHAVLNDQYEYKLNIRITPEMLLDLYDRVDVDYGILLPIVSPEGMTLVMPNGNTCAIAKQHPDRFFWFCNIDPRMMPYNSAKTDYLPMLSFYKELGARGVGEMTSNLLADDPRMENLFAQCAEMDMPVTIHIAPSLGGYYGIVDELGLPRLTKLLKKYPKLKIFGHSQPFWAEIGDNVTEENRFDYPTGKVHEGALARIMRECENLYLDMSAMSAYTAMTRDPDYSYRFIEEFGDRMMFGIDWSSPTNRHLGKLNTFLDEGAQNGSISEKNYRAICRGNVIRLLNLPLES